MIVGVLGWMGSGKDTIADRLIQHDFTRMSYAGTLKDAVAQVFGWDREMLEGKSPEGREWRESVDTWWANRLGIPKLTPRWVLQQWGTEVCRTNFHDDIWIASLENKLRRTNQHVVISDCRFPNEMESIRRLGGQLWWVQRGPLPDWYEVAVAANTGDEVARLAMEKSNIHISEWAWVGREFDQVIENNDSLDALHARVDQLTYRLLDPNQVRSTQVSL